MDEKQREQFLEELDKIHKQYNQKPNFKVLSKIQNEQINLIEEILLTLSKSNKTESELIWEKDCLLKAMGFIQSNKLKNRSNNNVIPSFIWQNIPLAEIEWSLTPEDERSKNLNKLKFYESISIESLLFFCRDLKGSN